MTEPLKDIWAIVKYGELIQLVQVNRVTPKKVYCTVHYLGGIVTEYADQITNYKLKAEG